MDRGNLVALSDVDYVWPGPNGGRLVLDRFEAAAGEHVFVSGPSGSGKSTLLGLLAGVLVPAHGRVVIRGEALGALSGARRDRFRADHIGIIFQQLNLLPYLSVLDNVMLACRFSAHRAHRASAQAEGEREARHEARHEGKGGAPAVAARALLARLDLAESLWHRPASRLSVGQQQRVAAARALLGRPELVLADEPTSALDAPRQAAFMALLQRECRAVDATLVFVSHDERLAARFDRRFTLPGVAPEPA